jgi:hypothetical protein
MLKLFTFLLSLSSDKMESAIANAKQILGITFELKPEQVAALQAFSEGRDFVCLLPTGFGKSVIFQMLPFLSDDPMPYGLCYCCVSAECDNEGPGSQVMRERGSSLLSGHHRERWLYIQAEACC